MTASTGTTTDAQRAWAERMERYAMEARLLELRMEVILRPLHVISFFVLGLFVGTIFRPPFWAVGAILLGSVIVTGVALAVLDARVRRHFAQWRKDIDEAEAKLVQR